MQEQKIEEENEKLNEQLRVLISKNREVLMAIFLTLFFIILILIIFVLVGISADYYAFAKNPYDYCFNLTFGKA